MWGFFVVGLNVTIRMVRQFCYRASIRRNSDWLEHIRGVHVALCIADIPIVKPYCWHNLSPQQRKKMSQDGA